MKPKLLFIVAVLLLTAGAGSSNKAAAAPNRAVVLNQSADSRSVLLTPARWACWTVPGSGLGRQCRWVEPGWRREGPGSGAGPGIGPGTGSGPRCWIERIPGSGLGPQRVCR